MPEVMDFSTVTIRSADKVSLCWTGTFDFVVWSTKLSVPVTTRVACDGSKLELVAPSGDEAIDEFVLNSEECLSDALSAIILAREDAKHFH